jgi:molecular chaperone DnaK (HSP70)
MITLKIESLSQEVDFRSKISRADFEHACSDLSPRFAQPIFDVLTSSGLTLVRPLYISPLSIGTNSLEYRRILIQLF